MSQIRINLLVPIFATRKAVALLSDTQSCWADHYGSIDTSNTNIRPLVIILWQNILKQQYVALNSLLTTLPNRYFHCEAHGDIYYNAVRLEKMLDREQTDRLRTN